MDFLSLFSINLKLYIQILIFFQPSLGRLDFYSGCLLRQPSEKSDFPSLGLEEYTNLSFAESDSMSQLLYIDFFNDLDLWQGRCFEL